MSLHRHFAYIFILIFNRKLSFERIEVFYMKIIMRRVFMIFYSENHGNEKYQIHGTAAFTLDVYGHVTEKMKRDSATRMQKFYESIRETSSSQ